ncbi:MAG: hypothetical protein ABI273_02090, partial [Lacunisphaera sp.]
MSTKIKLSRFDLLLISAQRATKSNKKPIRSSSLSLLMWLFRHGEQANYPSISVLAGIMGVHRNQIRIMEHQLVEAGLLEISDVGYNRKNYRILITNAPTA